MPKFNPRDRAVAGRVLAGTSFWTPFGERRLDDQLERANRENRATAKAIGLPTWDEVCALDFDRPVARALLPTGISLDEARVAFGETYPVTQGDSHMLVDPVLTEIHLTQVTLNHLTTASKKVHEHRYRFIPLIRPSVEQPTEIWEVWHPEQGQERRSRRRLYLAVFEQLDDFPGGVLSIATHTPARGAGYRFTHLTIYPLDEGRSLDRIEEKRHGRLVYAAYPWKADAS